MSTDDICTSTKSFIGTALPMLLHACAAVPFKSPSTTIAASSPKLPALASLSAKQVEVVVYEYLEQYIASRLYRHIFSLPANIDMDTKLCEHISGFQFITPSNLDIDEGLISNQTLEHLQEELFHMTSSKSPREKLVCIKRTFKSLFKLLSIDKTKPAIGADLLLPIVIYVLIKSNLPFLLSNIQFITLFRDPTLIEPETNYYLVTLITAATFIQNMTMESLTIIHEKKEEEKEIKEKEEEIKKMKEEQIAKEKVEELKAIAVAEEKKDIAQEGATIIQIRLKKRRLYKQKQRHK
eukprot:gene7045-8193_t